MPIGCAPGDIVEKLYAKIIKAATEAGLPGRPFFDRSAKTWSWLLNPPEKYEGPRYIFRSVAINMDEDMYFVCAKAYVRNYAVHGGQRAVNVIDGRKVLKTNGSQNISLSWLVKVLKEAKEAAWRLDVVELN